MSNTSASKTRSLTMTLLMVLMAISPMASVEADHNQNWFGDYELHVDGTLYEEVEVPWPSDVDILSCTQHSWDDRWSCEIDLDGDGNFNYPDYNQDMDYCDDSTGSWVCVYDYTKPLMDEGNYSLEYYVSGLDPDTNYTAYLNVFVNDFSDPFDFHTYTSEVFESDSNGEISIEIDEMYWDVTNSTCDGNSQIRLNWVDNGTEALQSQDYFAGWCEGEFHVTTELDGEEWESDPNYADNIIDCEMYGANWYCSADNHDNDGEADRFMLRFDMDQCEEDASGEWTCIQYTTNPLVWPGDHTLEWIASGLPDFSWKMQTQVWDSDAEDWIEEETYFNGTSASMDSEVSTDEFTCSLHSNYHLYEGEWDASGSWSEFGLFEDYHADWQGPCDESDSPISLWMDGEEHEDTPRYMEFDECVEDGFDHECWKDEWDYDGDGEPEFTYTHMQDCEEDASTGTWTCIEGYDEPLVFPGDHDFELQIEEIEDGWSYIITGYMNQHQQGIGYSNEQFGIWFNGTSAGDHTETWDMETFESTCNLNMYGNVRSGTWDSDGNWIDNYTYNENDNFNYRGPCVAPEVFTLVVDGEEYEVEYYEQYFDHCEEDGFSWRCWNDDWDNDGDGEPDWTNHQNDCEEDSSTGEWACINEWNYDAPEIDEGNHTMELTIDVEENTSYGLEVGVNICQNKAGCDNENLVYEFNSTSDSETITFYVETDNYTCDLDLNIQRYNIEWYDNGNTNNNNHIYEYFRFNGPCEEPPSPFTLTADGVEWEPIMNYHTYDYCEESDGDSWNDYDCWNDDWDNDGDGEPDWTNGEEDCEDVGTHWECEAWEQDPYIEAGNHTMELSVEGLEVGEEYILEYEFDVCQSMGGCDQVHDEHAFTATSDSESATFEIETDDYTCEVGINVHLLAFDEDGNEYDVAYDWFGYNGPCDQPPSPFTLTYDGIEWERTWNYEEYDECEDVDGHFECSNYDDGSEWHWEECEEDNSTGTWTCQTWGNDPEIEEGNHTMELTIEDLMVGTNYSVEWSFDVCQSMMGCDGEWDEFEFNATAETMSETFYIETDNYTCNLNIHVNLYEYDEGGWRDYIGQDHFSFQGPCEQPPSPFTLTYDGVEYEAESETLEYDNCEHDGQDMVCWQDMWDFDGDGDPDHTHWMNECEDMGTHWECDSPWMNSPEIEEGNHTMELTIEDLMVGTNYTLGINWNTWSTTGSGTFDDYEIEFNATAETMSETFYVETDDSTCSLNINVNLYDATNWDRISGYYYNFFGPCEQQMDDGLVLEYDDGSGAVEWEMAEAWEHYDHCWRENPTMDVCMNEGGNGLYWENECHPQESADGGFDCLRMEPPAIEEAADLDMTWTAEELEAGYNYTIMWHTCTWGMFTGEDCSDDDGEWPDHTNFTATSSDYSVDWELTIENSTCNVNIDWTLAGWGDNPPDFENHEPQDYSEGYMDILGPCQLEFPVDITLEVDDNGWQEVDDAFQELMEFSGEEDEEPDSNETADFVLSNIGYELSEGNWTMSWTMDDLDVDGDYEFGWLIEMVPGDEDEDDEDEPTFYCGNGDEIPFSWVNDGYEDCPDGADEQQYDEDGDPINWFDCSDGSEIWIYQVNDGVEDCPDGEDEWYYGGDDEGDDGDDGDDWDEEGDDGDDWDEEGDDGDDWDDEEDEPEYDDYYSFTATSDSESLEWVLEVPEDACLMTVQGDLMSIEEEDGWTQTMPVGMFFAIILGPWAEEDEDGDGIPDCLAMLLEEDYGDGDLDGDGWSFEDFAIGEDYSAVLVEVDVDDESAVAAIHQHTTLDDEIRMKIDYDFFDGDGVLNESEAAMFEMEFIEGSSEEGCSEQSPPFTMNGFAPWCATNHVWFENLANNTDGHSPVWVQGWDLHYNVTVDDAGQMTFHYAGDIAVWGEDADALDFDATLCGGALDGAGLVPVSWSYNGTTMTGDCVGVMAGDYIEEIEMVFGYPDTDGDGYNDFDDRFPDDPEEWADSDDDGVGDNHDEFPNDPNETNDADGDGVGDNGDAFPWDASESADSDGDGWGDNSDAFPNDNTEWVDTDGDGVGDNADTDADNDGTDDTDEDSDGDGVNDDQDDFPFDANETTDTDGDGVGDNADDFPDDANETTDTDGDGTGDNSDEDADGDGTPNDLDDFPLNSGESTDSDGDGVGDSEDTFPNNPNEWSDYDGDGVGDNADTDDDNDGTPDTSDAFPLDPSESTDTDGDGYGDNTDAFLNDAGEWSDYDGDGVGDNSDAFMSDPYESRDSDGDGVGDNADWAPNDPNEIIDTDGDGCGNNKDQFDNDPAECEDTDGDGIGDNADTDDDGDGIPDDGVDPVEGEDSGGILPGFTAITGLASVLGAAILVAGRRKD